MITTLYSPKGGSGTTTVAAALAVSSAENTDTVLIDAVERGACATMLGLVEPTDHTAQPVNAGLTLVSCGPDKGAIEAASHNATVFVDCGNDGALATELGNIVLMVVRPDYLALRRAVAAPGRPTGVVLVKEEGRSLNKDDVEAVIGVPVIATIDVDASIARSIDAGLLLARLPKALAQATQKILGVTTRSLA